MYNEPNFTHLYQLKTFICAGLVIYDWELFTENCLFLGGKKGLTTSDGQEEETRDHF
jgi:hypothetical protein